RRQLLQQAMKRGGKALLGRARKRLERHIRALSEAPDGTKTSGAGAGRRAQAKNNPDQPWKHGESIERLVDSRVDELQSLLFEFDWKRSLPRPNVAVVPLTTGPHRVELTIFAAGLGVHGSAIGAASAALSTTVGTVRFRARNPESWPRLRSEVTLSASAGTTVHEVSLHA